MACTKCYATMTSMCAYGRSTYCQDFEDSKNNTNSTAKNSAPSGGLSSLAQNNELPISFPRTSAPTDTVASTYKTLVAYDEKYGTNHSVDYAKAVEKLDNKNDAIDEAILGSVGGIGLVLVASFVWEVHRPEIIIVTKGVATVAKGLAGGVGGGLAAYVILTAGKKLYEASANTKDVVGAGLVTTALVIGGGTAYYNGVFANILDKTKTYVRMIPPFRSESVEKFAPTPPAPIQIIPKAPLAERPIEKPASAQRPQTATPATVETPFLSYSPQFYITRNNTRLKAEPYQRAQSIRTPENTCVAVADSTLYNRYVHVQSAFNSSLQGWVQKSLLIPAPDCGSKDAGQQPKRAAPQIQQGQSAAPPVSNSTAFTVVASRDSYIYKGPSQSFGVAAVIRPGDCVRIEGTPVQSGFEQMSVDKRSGVVTGWVAHLEFAQGRTCSFN